MFLISLLVFLILENNHNQILPGYYVWQEIKTDHVNAGSPYFLSDKLDIYWHEITFSKNFDKKLKDRGFIWNRKFVSPAIGLGSMQAEFNGYKQGLYLVLSDFESGISAKFQRDQQLKNFMIAKDIVKESLKEKGIKFKFLSSPTVFFVKGIRLSDYIEGTWYYSLSVIPSLLLVAYLSGRKSNQAG